MTETEPIVFIVDDDDSVRKSLARLTTSMGLKVETFSSANAFLKRDSYDGPAGLVLDVRMPGLSGLDLQTELAKAERTLSIVFITGHGNIAMGVQALNPAELVVDGPHDATLASTRLSLENHDPGDGFIASNGVEPTD